MATWRTDRTCTPPRRFHVRRETGAGRVLLAVALPSRVRIARALLLPLPRSSGRCRPRRGYKKRGRPPVSSPPSPCVTVDPERVFRSKRRRCLPSRERFAQASMSVEYAAHAGNIGRAIAPRGRRAAKHRHAELAEIRCDPHPVSRKRRGTPCMLAGRRRRAGLVPASCASSYASRNTSANNELKLESVRNASTTRAKPASRRAPPPPAPCACRRPSIAAPCARRQVAPASQHADGAAGVLSDSAPSMRAPGPACGVTASGRFDGARDAQGATDASPHTRRPASASMIRLTTDAPPTCASALPLHAASSPTGAIVFLSRVAKPCLAIAADAERSRGRVSKPRKARFASNDSRPEAVAIENIARAGKRAAVPPIADERVETAEPISASR